jgi:penicillin G amidase
VIAVNGKPDVAIEVLVTPRGPIVSPLFTDLAHAAEAISLKAVWLEPLPLWGFLGAARARSFEEFRSFFEAWPVLPLNVVYADAEGTIGWQLVGQLPRRRGGHGLLPCPADSPNSGWQRDLIPFHEMPYRVNPPEGLIATANQAPDCESPFLGCDFIDSYRSDTIRDELGRRGGWDVASCSELQMSTRSLPWEAMKNVVLTLEPSDPQAREAITLLREWDGQVTADSPAAAIFELFVAEMCVRAAKAKAPRAWQAALGDVGLGAAGHNLFADRRVAHLIVLLSEQPGGWFARSWPDEMIDVLGGIVRTLRREVGPAASFWAWGHLRQLRLDHLLFGKHWLLGRVFNLGPIPCGGDQNTVSQAGARPLHPTDFSHNIANLRTVFDLADLSKSAFVLCGGQSGNPCSPHHADQLPLWQDGESIAIPWTQEEVIRSAKHTLRLLP